MYKKHNLWVLCIVLLYSQLSLAEIKESISADKNPMVKSIISLDMAINRALEQSPRLSAYQSAALAADAEKKQAGVLPNPELDIESENVEGSGPYNGFDSAETTYGISQLVEIGGKRSARRMVAEHGQKIADFDYQAVALDLIRDVTVAYSKAVAADENLKLAKEQNTLANEVMRSVNARVNAAAAPLMEKSRGQVELATAILVSEKAIRQRDIAYKNLAVLMGDDHAEWQINSESFFTVKKPNPEVFSEKVKRNPDVMKLNTALKQSKARLDLEKANAIPDPTVSVGMRQFREGDDQALTIGMSIPLPVFNTNRNNILKAGHEVSKTEYEQNDALLMLDASFEEIKQELDISYIQADTFVKEILPAAQKAFDLANRSYKADKLPYFEVLDTQRTLFDVKQQYLETLNNYHLYRAELERLAATHLDRIKAAGE